jgi:glycosyltransferase involved in cell wall biosynthesis
MSPRFSIVIPVHNRSALVLRAIASCLSQRSEDFEVIVVDDGSTDRTPDDVARIADPRVRLIVQPANRGTCPARNVGADRAAGDWIVSLDSDDELTDDALPLIASEIDRLPDHVDGLRFMCRLDDGRLSPDPPLQREIWNYEGYVRWAASTLHTRQESLPCVRRKTFERVRYVDGRGSLESLYHLDFAKTFVSAASPAVVRMYHAGADDRLTSPDVPRMISGAGDYMRTFELVLRHHAPAFEAWAPSLLTYYTRALATQQFLANQRIAGLRTIGSLVRRRQASLDVWSVLTFGLMGPRALAWIKAARAHRRTAASPSR